MPGSEISLKDLITGGFLRPNEELECRPRKGESYPGKLNADGTIRFGDRIFEHPSQWANYVTSARTRNGWEEVYARGEKIAVFRESIVEETDRPFPSPEPSDTPEAGMTLTPDSEDGSRENIDEARRYILGLTQSDFEELTREYLEAKGFSNAEITVVLKMTI